LRTRLLVLVMALTLGAWVVGGVMAARAAHDAAGRAECTNGCVHTAHASCDGKPTPFERDLCISASLKPCCKRCGSSIAEANFSMCN
ncbi:MAG TPA: hypothetical protein PLR99_13720, partial [Polyangiaceae bacterium]|nr:hypothetical protein [Polyangiaceae bacterium]